MAKQFNSRVPKAAKIKCPSSTMEERMRIDAPALLLPALTPACQLEIKQESKHLRPVGENDSQKNTQKDTKGF